MAAVGQLLPAVPGGAQDDGKYPSGGGRLAVKAGGAKGVTLGLALRSHRDGWEGSRGRTPPALEQTREGSDRRRDADAGGRGLRGRTAVRRGAEPALHVAKTSANGGAERERRLDFASG